ncbi:MAG: cobalamin-binding protein [Acidobacteria bacterium]|nr:MAG: cobalamin-binding protein [Acidobacteriota bacterium]
MRIVSLLPSATEILYALGLGDQVLGVSHECDFPEPARSKPAVTRCAFDYQKMNQQQIDDAVRSLAQQGKSLYEIDDAKLQEIDPDLIITQELCHVCAITPDEVNRATAKLKRQPQILSLNTKLLEDVFSDMVRIGEIAGVDARQKVDSLQKRVKRVASQCLYANQVSVGCIEWLDPLWRTGHWIPEMVRLAGGSELFAEIARPSRSLSFEELEQKNPEVLILMPCGYSLEKTRKEFDAVIEKYPWRRLQAFKTGQVFLVDANSYFSRSGPRLVEGLELLAEILHPEYFTNVAPVHSYIRFEFQV